MAKTIKSKNNKDKNHTTHLTLNERILIEINYHNWKSFREIAEVLGNGRTSSTIFREIDRRPRRGLGKYQAYVAHEKALAKRADRGKRPRLKNEMVRKYTTEKMKLGWSPEQVSIRLPIDHSGQGISHEAIYQFVYAGVSKSGTVRVGHEDLRPYLARRQKRRKCKGFRQTQKLWRPVLPSIEDRPASVDRRTKIGDWEDDTMVSRQSLGRFKTVNERKSGVVFIGKMKDGSIEESNRVVLTRLQDIPSMYLRTLTRDRGVENFGYLEIEKKLNMSCYFAHAYSSYERGSNENTNGLIRRFFPKGTDLAKISHQAVINVEYLLNTRPRKRLGGLTPYEVFFRDTGVALKC